MTLEMAPAHTQPVAGIRELTPRDIDQLRFGFWSRASNEDVKRTIESYPGRSVWLPDTLEYAIVGPWRHRMDVANVQELSAVRHPAGMLQAVVRQCDEFGASVVISIEVDEVRRPAFYQRAGFQLMEEVVTYDFDGRHPIPDYGTKLRFRRADVGHREDLDLLLSLDHASFPWLWWNSEEEFVAYSRAPGVEMLIGYDGDQPVSYVGITAYLGWGHLDRIAVAPGQQGRGFGGESLAIAVNRLIQTGAKRVGLSTQSRNARSQRLYERFGFRRATEHDYRLYGRVLRLPNGLNTVTDEV